MTNKDIFKLLIRWHMKHILQGNGVDFSGSGVIISFPCGLKAYLTCEELAEELLAMD